MCFACIVLFFPPFVVLPYFICQQRNYNQEHRENCLFCIFRYSPNCWIAKERNPPHSNQNILLSPKSRGTITRKKLHCVNVKPFVNEDRAIRSSVSSLESFLCVCVFDSSRHNVPSRCLYQVESSSRKKKKNERKEEEEKNNHFERQWMYSCSWRVFQVFHHIPQAQTLVLFLGSEDATRYSSVASF